MVTVVIYLNSNMPLYKWLKTQPKEFVSDVNKNELYGDGQFTMKDLAELDNKFNPEDENDRDSK